LVEVRQTSLGSAEPEIEPEQPEFHRFIDSVIEESVAGRTEKTAAQTSNRLDRLFAESSPVGALALWFGGQARGRSLRQLARMLGRDIARLDGLLTEQVNTIIHHPRFQQLEASWRGLKYLADQLEEGVNIKICVLSVSWKELQRDQERAIEFDRSQLFRKVYSDEFGMPGGEPFGVLIGDYEVQLLPGDLETLSGISGTAAAAFAPFIAAAHPSIFDLEDFSSLERPINLQRVFEQKDHIKFRAFRDTQDSRFVGLTMPRVLRRLPYEDDGARVDGFRFFEDVAGMDASKYLWGNAAYTFAAVLMRSFADSRWLADIRGVQRGVEGGGLVTGLPVHSFSTDKRDVARKTSTDVTITDALEKELGELGFIPLCDCKDTEFSAFYTNQSLQKPRKYDRPAATLNAQISSMLQYMLCVSRFAHYIKVLARDQVGSFHGAQDCQRLLQDWLVQYVNPDDDASDEAKARRPLREAQVEVQEIPESPGAFQCQVHLWPHFELDDLTAAIRVTADLAPMEQ